MQLNLLDKSLETLMGTNEDALLSLRDGSSLTGKIRDFDSYVVLVSGDPDRMVYRHSIMKLMPASAKLAQARDKVGQRPRPAKPQKPPAAKPRKQPAAKPPRETVRPPAPSTKLASDAAGFSNPMADAMQKWIKNQKGGA